MSRTFHTAACLFVAITMAPLLAASQTAERSRTEGLKETDRFIKAGGTTSQAVATAKLQVQKTLDSYNALVTQPSKNMKSEYKRMMSAMDEMNAKVTDARQKVVQMETTGKTYFTGRAETIKGITDPALQGRAQERLTDSQKGFGEVLETLRESGEALEPFRKQLADQITYLGSDLTPTATASLKPEAEKLNATGAETFAKTDAAITKANTYFQGLRAQSST
jgi:hypothetical protein